MTKTLFDHLNDVHLARDGHHFDSLESEDQKSYSQYMVSRFLSMEPAYLNVVNLLQQYWGQTSNREHFMFFQSVLPRRKVYTKYIKKTGGEEYPENALKLTARHFQISLGEAKDYLRVLNASEAGLERLRGILEGYGESSQPAKKARKKKSK